jgi:translation initiation factor 2 subunit 2
VRKQPKAPEPEAIVEGNVYDFMIEDVGKKGDGIARKENIIIYIPGTAKGSRARVKITKRSGTVAFGQVTTEQPTPR